MYYTYTCARYRLRDDGPSSSVQLQSDATAEHVSEPTTMARARARMMRVITTAARRMRSKYRTCARARTPDMYSILQSARVCVTSQRQNSNGCHCTANTIIESDYASAHGNCAIHHRNGRRSSAQHMHTKCVAKHQPPPPPPDYSTALNFRNGINECINHKRQLQTNPQIDLKPPRPARKSTPTTRRQPFYIERRRRLTNCRNAHDGRQVV